MYLGIENRPFHEYNYWVGIFVFNNFKKSMFVTFLLKIKGNKKLSKINYLPNVITY